MSAVRFPLRIKLAVFGVLLAAIPAAIVGIGLINVNASTLETQSREFRLALADDIASSVESTIVGTNEDLVGVQQVLTDVRVAEDARIDVALALVESSPRIDSVDIYDKKGDYITSIVQGKRLSPPLDTLPANTQKHALDDPFFTGSVTADNKNITFELVRRIQSSAGPTGFLRTEVPFTAVHKRGSDLFNSRLSRESELYVVDAAGTMLSNAKGNPGTKAPGGGLLDNPEAIIAKGIALSGEVPQREMLVSARPLELVPWLVVVEIPLEEAYASVQRMRFIVIGVMLAAILAAVLVALGFASRLTRPIEALVAFTRKLADRGFDARVDVDTNDEISVLADGLNKAASDLQVSEERIAEEIAIRNDLGRYLSRDLVDNVVNREQDMALGGARREITVLFADVVRFTPLCDQMSPEAIVSILNELFTILTEIVFRHGGTVDKFIGDCVMAFWGAPKPMEDHASHALFAAEEMLQWLEVGNAKWREEYGVTVQLAVGINTGPAVIGNIGSDTRMEYTAIGATINTAARLEALARPQQILTTGATRDAVDVELFDFSVVSTEMLSTLGDDVTIYEVMT